MCNCDNGIGKAAKQNVERKSKWHKVGKPRGGMRGGEWRYRIGDFRLWAEIRREEIVILVLAVGHRCEIYDHVRRRDGKSRPWLFFIAKYCILTNSEKYDMI